MATTSNPLYGRRAVGVWVVKVSRSFVYRGRRGIEFDIVRCYAHNQIVPDVYAGVHTPRPQENREVQE